MSNVVLFKGTNFVVRDLREEIDQYRGVGFPSWWHGHSSKSTQHLDDPRTVNLVVFHQNYGNILPAEKGPIATARFCTRSPVFKCQTCGTVWEGSPQRRSCPNGHPGQSKRIKGGRGFPKHPYHVWVPYTPQIDEKGRIIIYQCLDFMERSSHTGSGANAHGIAVCIQGMHYSRHLGKKFRAWPGTDGRMSKEQAAILPNIFPEWLTKHANLSLGAKDIAGHFMFGKAACPGDEVEYYIRAKRGEKVGEFSGFEYIEAGINKDDPFDTWEERQRVLYILGYDLGSYGSNGDGVDGKPGSSTRQAIEDFQSDKKIVVDGLWGRQTENSILDTLKANGIEVNNLEDTYKRLRDSK